jgi:tetratricopeptide (TPR) repeat protein
MTVKTTAAFLAVALAATTAGAQQRPASRPAAQSTAPKCDIQSGGSAQIMSAYEALSKASEQSAPDAEKKRQLASAVKLLSAPLTPAQAELARQWVLGQTLVAYTLLDNQPTVGTRASFGFATDPQATVDILALADTAFSAVQKAAPGCATQIAGMRQLPYRTMTNAAVALFNAGNMDSAQVLATRAMSIMPEGAPAYHLLANVAVKKQDYPRAISHFERAMATSKGDSALTEVYATSLSSLAVLVQNQAATATGEEQKALAAKAAGYYRELIAASPNDASAQASTTRGSSSTPASAPRTPSGRPTRSRCSRPG